MVYAYIRVSTENQTTDNQKIEILKYCKQHEIDEPIFVQETISGTKEINERKLGELIQELKQNDILLITELSRLGRKMRSVQKTINMILDKKIKCIVIKEGFNLGDDLISQCLSFAFSMSAQIERDLLSERVKMGLQRARQEGKIVGRHYGSKSSHYKLDNKKDYIVIQIKNNKSLNSLSKELNVKWSTLRNFCERNNISYKGRVIKYNFIK